MYLWRIYDPCVYDPCILNTNWVKRTPQNINRTIELAWIDEVSVEISCFQVFDSSLEKFKKKSNLNFNDILPLAQ